MIKKHPITIICEWLNKNKENIIKDQLYYFIIDTNGEQVASVIKDDINKDALDQLDKFNIEEHVRSVLSNNHSYAKISNSQISDKIAYPFVFYGIDNQNHFVYDWYFFWFNLSEHDLSYYKFAKIIDCVDLL